MNLPGPHLSTATERLVLVLLVVAVSLALAWILAPFYGTILWAGIIALLFAPVQRRLLRRLRGRRTLAALLTLLLVLLIVIVPFTLVSTMLAREAMGVYARVQSDPWNTAVYLRGLFDALPAPVVSLLEHFGLTDFEAVQRRLNAAVAQGSEFIANHAMAIGQNTFEFVAGLFITTYVAFFLIRDGDRVLEAVREAIPLAPAHKAELLGKFATVIRATIKGSLVVAAIQGALGGIAFWALGVQAALLCGVLMAFLSLVPAVGAALVWFPVAIFLLLTGSVWQGLALLAYGMLVIGLIDNLLRPILVGRDTRMPDYVVMLTTLGGLAAVGINGFVLGPSIAAMFIAVWHLYGVAQQDVQRAPPA
jgi:predicted PurR-regulated permease PerM